MNRIPDRFKRIALASLLCSLSALYGCAGTSGGTSGHVGSIGENAKSGATTGSATPASSSIGSASASPVMSTQGSGAGTTDGRPNQAQKNNAKPSNAIAAFGDDVADVGIGLSSTGSLIQHTATMPAGAVIVDTAGNALTAVGSGISDALGGQEISTDALNTTVQAGVSALPMVGAGLEQTGADLAKRGASDGVAPLTTLSAPSQPIPASSSIPPEKTSVRSILRRWCKPSRPAPTA